MAAVADASSSRTTRCSASTVGSTWDTLGWKAAGLRFHDDDMVLLLQQVHAAVAGATAPLRVRRQVWVSGGLPTTIQPAPRCADPLRLQLLRRPLAIALIHPSCARAMRSAAGSASGIPRRSVSAHLVAVGLRPSFPLCSLGLRAMASKLAQTVASSAGARSHVRDFYLEVRRARLAVRHLGGAAPLLLLCTGLLVMATAFGRSQVCRCIPFIQRLHKLEEIASLRELRAAVKGKFNEFKDAKDPRVREARRCCRSSGSACSSSSSARDAIGAHRSLPQVVDLLIFKGREELEVRAVRSSSKQSWQHSARSATI